MRERRRERRRQCVGREDGQTRKGQRHKRLRGCFGECNNRATDCNVCVWKVGKDKDCVSETTERFHSEASLALCLSGSGFFVRKGLLLITMLILIHAETARTHAESDVGGAGPVAHCDWKRGRARAGVGGAGETPRSPGVFLSSQVNLPGLNQRKEWPAINM